MGHFQAVRRSFLMVGDLNFLVEGEAAHRVLSVEGEERVRGRATEIHVRLDVEDHLAVYLDQQGLECRYGLNHHQRQVYQDQSDLEDIMRRATSSRAQEK